MRTLRLLLGCALGGAAAACSSSPLLGPLPSGSDAGGGAPEDASVVVVTNAPPPASATGDPGVAGGTADAATDPTLADAGAADAAPLGACSAPLAAGDLAIVEIMVASVAGARDHGEWLEVQSTRDCAIDLAGLHGETEVGAKVATFDVPDDTWLPPRGTFLVADSADPVVDHDLPGLLFTWSGLTGDVLRNQGSTVSLRAGAVLVDSVTYPPCKLPPGTSWAFPADCDPRQRDDFGLWQPSSASWFPGFEGTPNAPNADVRCPPPS